MEVKRCILDRVVDLTIPVTAGADTVRTLRQPRVLLTHFHD